MTPSLHMREENLRRSIDGICASCGKGKVDFREECHLRLVYRIGECDACGYEHHIFVTRL